jgi:TolA-binding protein
MSSEKKHSAQHEELLKKQALEQQEVKEVLVFIQKYSKPVLITVIAISAVVLVDRFFKSKRYQKEARADAALAQANTVEDLQAVIDEYGSTPAAPLALMNLAREKFNAGQIEDAEDLYNRFLKKHKNHELAEQAELNRISCLEAKGQLGDAHLLYGEFQKKNKDSFLAPMALLNKARCLENLGELVEAKQVYEDMITYYPGTGWAQTAETKLQLVSTKMQ